MQLVYAEDASAPPRLCERRVLAAVGVILVALIAPVVLATAASAHPTDELLQLLFVTPTPDGLTIDIQLVPGVLVAPVFMKLVDTDGDHVISPAEAGAYATGVADAITVVVDGRSEPLSVVHTKYPAPTVLAVGGRPIVLELAAHAPQTTATRTVTVLDRYGPVRTRTIVNFSPTPDAPVTVTSSQCDQDGRRFMVRFTARAPRAPAAAAEARTSTDSDKAVATADGASSAIYLLDALRRPLTSPWAFVTLLLASAGLGALHALTPGHGKALLAGYLIGDRGTPRQAVALGMVITVTHTASVIGIGVATLVASRYMLPGVLVPALELGSGLLVVALGVRLLVRRWRERGHSHEHPHHHHHPTPHDHPTHLDHAHDHDHVPPRNGGSSRAALLAMGASGGILPCPEALAVLLLAIAVHRIAVGLCLVVAFSAGLAAVLVGLGLVLVAPRVGGWLRLHTAGDRRLTRLVPLASAAVVAVLGLGMTLTGAEALITR